MIEHAITILQSWGIAWNPDEKAVAIGAQRLAICEACEFKSEIPYKRCTACKGCPIKVKIFSPNKNVCDKQKWPV